ncbi:hypothetical protein BC826DRAFT_979844 [Russula brevipes]|nr:hypothetical protein BC826DRAFT_979844 [Russula brevipes]
MDTPNLIVVPPTPLDAKPAPSPSPSISTAPSTPGLTQSSDENPRDSSETTMEIYSMYGDDDRSSWPNDRPSHLSQATELAYHNVDRSSRESSTYYSATAKSHQSSRTGVNLRASAVSTASGSSSGSTSSPYVGIEDDNFQSVLPPTPPSKPPQRQSGSRSSHPNLGGATERTSPQSRRPSSSRSHSPSAFNGHAAAIPRPSPRPPSEQASVKSPSSRLISRPASQTTATSTSPRLLARKRSELSITPSAGEDPDSFHIRSTYAQLDVLGVKGDGIEEGVERTRARVGAMNAVGDEQEKRRDLSPHELQMLASLDRYGFFALPSHDRLVLLPTAALLRPLSRISRVNTSSSASSALLPSLPRPRPPLREYDRMEKWGRMLEPRSRDAGGNIQTWGLNLAKEHKLSRRAFKGIPDRWRSAAWLALIDKFAQANKDQLLAFSIDYREALEKHSQYDIQIDLDVPRTINGHILFRTRYGLGQRSLFHVLHAFSLRCDRCGYCQGMGPIAAMLLCYFEPERAYASLVHLHDSYHMHDIFSPGFPERITEQMMPAVYAAFKKHMVSTTSYATKWYITLFANSVPFQTHLRPDLFVIVAVSVIWVYRDHITSDSANFETVLSLLSSFFVPEDEDVYLNWIAKVAENKKIRSEMQSWRAEWKALVSSGRDGDALL